MDNDVKTKNNEDIAHFFSAGDRMIKEIDVLRKKNRPLLGGHRYLTDDELSRLLHINRRTLQDYRNMGRISFEVIPVSTLGRYAVIHERVTDYPAVVLGNGNHTAQEHHVNPYRVVATLLLCAQEDVAFAAELCNGAVDGDTTHHGNGTVLLGSVLFEVEQNLKRTTHNSDFYGLQNYLLSGYLLLRKTLSFNGMLAVFNLMSRNGSFSGNR